MAHAASFAVAMMACYLVAQLLTHSNWLGRSWSWRSPRLAIICWQALGLAVGLCAIGLPLALGLTPYQAGTGTALRSFTGDLTALGAAMLTGAAVTDPLPAGLGPVQLGLIGLGGTVATVLLGLTARSLVTAVRAQRRHRNLLTLVARADPAVPGALVLDHPRAAAYCLPGMRPTIVVSAGTLSLLDANQLAAVLSHERAHADERHDLVLLPFSALRTALPRVGWVRTAHRRVALLVEMRADDKAREQHTDELLADALRRFAAAPARMAPAGTLGIADRDLEARVRRLLLPGRPPRLPGLVALTASIMLVALPVSLFLS